MNQKPNSRCQRPVRAGLVILLVWLVTIARLSADIALPTSVPPGHLANDYIIKSWSTENGLPHPTARSMTVAADGFVWIGTFNGLARIESGPSATQFSLEEMVGSKTEACVALMGDQANRLWVGTDESVLVRENRKWTSLPAPKGTRWGMTTGLAHSLDGTAFIGTASNIFSVSNNIAILLEEPTRLPNDRSPFRPLVSTTGTLWLRTDLALWYRDTGHWVPVHETLGLTNTINGLAAAEHGGLWISEPHRLRLVVSNTMVREIVYPADFRDSLVSLLEDHSGQIWVGGFSRGLLRIQTDGVVRQVSGREGLSSPHITSLIETPEGVIFIGFGGYGALQLTPRRVRILHGHQPDPWDSQIGALTVDGRNQVFYSTGNRAVLKSSDNGETLEQVFSIPPPNHIRALACGAEGELWIGTDNLGLFRTRNGVTLEVFDKTQIGTGSINSLLYLPNGALWIGTAHGVGRYLNGRFDIFDSKVHPDMASVQSIVAASEDEIRFASVDAIFSIDATGLHKVPFDDIIPAKSIVGLVLDPSGDGIWFTQRGGGIGWRRANGNLHFIPTRAGAPSFGLGSLICDAQNQIWASSRYGLYRFDTPQLKAVALGTEQRLSPFSLGQQAGLLSDDCQPMGGNGSALGKDGSLWFTSQNGVVLLKGSVFERNTHAPRAYVLKAEQEDQEAFPVDGSMHLQPGLRHVDVVLTSSSLAPADTIFYDYRAMGGKSDWLPNGSSRLLRLNLPGPGIHRFEVRAHNSDGVADLRPMPVVLHIPPLLSEHWAIRYLAPTLLLVTIAIITGLAYRRRVETLKNVIQANSERREMEETLRLVVTNTQASLAYLDQDLELRWGNDTFYELFSKTPLVKADGKPGASEDWEHFSDLHSRLQRARRGQGQRFEWTTPTLPPRIHIVTLIPHSGPSGSVIGVFASCVDITQLKADAEEKGKLEQQLLQSQKMEALGTMAGGIAHDFNNILTAIAGNAQLAMMDLPESHEAQASLREVRKAARRAAGLVRQILTFSRQGEHEKEDILLRPALQEAVSFLKVGLAANIQINTRFASTPQPIHADPTQIHQIILNLATNAFHAMRSNGGTLTLEETLVEMTAEARSSVAGLHPGRYIRLRVSDTGIGMDRATLDKAFDPFFTTKGPNEGTGLGLSVVHGIMQRLGGAITVESQVNKGTTFELFFPCSPGPQSPGPRTHSHSTPNLVSGNGQRVMLVDDDTALVALMERVLVRLDYKVVSFTCPRSALDAFKKNAQDFAVLITDLSMPELSGSDLVKAMRSIQPDLPVILTTGYIRPEDEQIAGDLGIQALMLKPGSLEEMSRLLAQVLQSSLSS